jgi:hypothetical protein
MFLSFLRVLFRPEPGSIIGPQKYWMCSGNDSLNKSWKRPQLVSRWDEQVRMQFVVLPGYMRFSESETNLLPGILKCKLQAKNILK